MEIRILQGTIDKMYDYEAIVNPTNTHLRLGKGGVANALIRHGGDGVIQAAMDIARDELPGKKLARGACVITGAGSLANQFVVHVAVLDPDEVPAGTVGGPIVRECVAAAIRLADQERVTSLAFPVVGAGLGGMPVEEAAEAILEEMHAASPTHIQRLAVVVPDEGRFRALARRHPNLAYQERKPSLFQPLPAPKPKRRQAAGPPPLPSKSFSEILATSAGRPEHRYGPGCPQPATGDRLSHPVFGRGIVTAIRGDKWDVLFQAGLKTLKKPS